jgi:DNA-binding NtrC family response regulator
MIARILIIDDEPRWIKFAQGDLGTEFEVDVATNLEEALDKLNRGRYDVLVASSRRVDILEAISNNYPDKRVVVATGQPTTREAITMYRFGILDYFAKDFRLEVVSEKIMEAIKKPKRTRAQSI